MTLGNGPRSRPRPLKLAHGARPLWHALRAARSSFLEVRNDRHPPQHHAGHALGHCHPCSGRRPAAHGHLPRSSGGAMGAGSKADLKVCRDRVPGEAVCDLSRTPAGPIALWRILSAATSRLCIEPSGLGKRSRPPRARGSHLMVTCEPVAGQRRIARRLLGSPAFAAWDSGGGGLTSPSRGLRRGRALPRCPAHFHDPRPDNADPGATQGARQLGR